MTKARVCGWYFTLIGFLLTAGWWTCTARAVERPNIVLIVIDDLGYGDLGCYGNAVHKTPHVDRLATEGMRLTDFHTNGPVCSPTRVALLTGRYQQRSGIESAIGFTREIGMPLSERTIAERLDRVGYTSGVFGKWHVGHVAQFGPNLQGFEESWCSNNSPDYHTHVSRVGELDWFHNHEPSEEPGYLTDLVTRHTCDFIQRHRSEPFFAFVSHIAVHFPFQGPEDPPHRMPGKIWHDVKYGPLPSDEYKRAYRDMLEAVDRSVGEVVTTLEQLGIRDRTLIVVTSDNGAYSWVGNNGPFRGQKGDLFEGGHRVPAIFNWPGRIRSGTTSDQTAMTMDILPTLLAVAGIDERADPPLDGIDLSPMLFEGKPLEPRKLFWRFRQAHAVRQGALKYVAQDGKRYLFDLERDPSERDNLIDRCTAEAQAMQVAYRSWLARLSTTKEASVADTPWIDLGDEGKVLYVGARMQTPAADGQPRFLTLATTGGAIRASAGVNETGHYSLWLYDHAVVGDICEPGSDVMLVLKIMGHSRQPDQVHLKVLTSATDLPEREPTQWTLSNGGGSSDADLARIVIVPPEAVNAVNGVRVARTWDGLQRAGEVETTVAEASIPEPMDLSPPHPVENPDSALMLDLSTVETDPSRIDFAALPRVPSEHVVVSDVRARNGVNQHNYLVHHRDRYWAMWSDGPGVEDQVGQRVKFATSPEGLEWSRPQFLAPVPPGSGPDSPHYGTRTLEGMRWISRGFWQRGDELYALASLDEAAGFFGPSLELHAFRLEPDGTSWEDAGVIADNTINNFPPKRLPTGEWMMSRRPHNYRETGVHFLVGGVTAIDDWRSFPVLGSSSELAAEEPLWWVLPDGNMMALFRDNRGSKRIYRSFSTDNGRTWSRPVRTNFPDATSKMHGLRLRDGRYVLVSNSNPARRDPLTLAVSDDGMVFTDLLYLVGGRHVDYPYVMQHEDYLLVAFAGGKQTVEVLKIPLEAVDAMVGERSGP